MSADDIKQKEKKYKRKLLEIGYFLLLIHSFNTVFQATLFIHNAVGHWKSKAQDNRGDPCSLLAGSKWVRKKAEANNVIADGGVTQQSDLMDCREAK